MRARIDIGPPGLESASRRGVGPGVVVGAALALLVAGASVVYSQPLTVTAIGKISALKGGFGGTLRAGDRFGWSAVQIGDLDADGVSDLAIGAPTDDDGGADRGAVWIVFLAADGSVKGERKISSTAGGFTGALDDNDRFGSAVAPLGDLDADGVPDLAVGAPYDDDHKPGVDPDDPKSVDDGAVYVLFMKRDGTVKSHQKISMKEGGFPNPEPTTFHGEMGTSLAARFSPQGTLERLAIGGAGDDDGGPFDRGAVWIATLNANGTVASAPKISATRGGFTGVLDSFDRFGTAVAWLGDVDGDGIPDLAVGAPGDDDHDPARGAVWILFLKADATVKAHQKISGTQGGLVVLRPPDQWFGSALASLGDLDGNGVEDLAVGFSEAHAVAEKSGAVEVLLLTRAGTVLAQQEIADAIAGESIRHGDGLGASPTAIGDLDGDGIGEIAVGAPYTDGLGSDRGAVWIFFADGEGGFRARTKIGDRTGGFRGLLDDGDAFGTAVASVGDLDGDGIDDIAVGAPMDDDGGTDRGAVWILFLDARGNVRRHQKISDTAGGFPGGLRNFEWFGYSIAPLGDLDGDGVTDLAIGAVNDFDGGTGNRGAVWILFLRRDGRVKAHQKISVTEGNFTGAVDQADDFGRSLANVGDLDGDGVPELAVGANRDDDGGADRGAVWLLFLTSAGTVRSYQKISQLEGGFNGVLDDDDYFGWSVAGVGDFDLDGIPDLAVGAMNDDDGGIDRGAAWLLALRRTGRVKATRKISSTSGALVGLTQDGARFGSGLGNLGDLDGDGVAEIGVGASGEHAGGFARGALYVITPTSRGTVEEERKLDSTSPVFADALEARDFFGSSIAVLDDFDGDGRADLAVGAVGDDDGGSTADAEVGAMWLLYLADYAVTTTSSTTTTLPPADCGDANGDGKISAADALVALLAAVALGACEPCACDTDASGAVTAADALRILQAAVGQPVVLDCPPCW
jgi:hypothetical protein